MNIYVIQALTGQEEKFLALAKRSLPPEDGNRLIWPRRDLERLSRGRWFAKREPLYPGYVFYRADSVDPENYRAFQSIPGFLRFLMGRENILPLSQDDLTLLSHFLAFGEIVPRSQVYFDENNLIRIVQGPLMGLEGRIIKVNRRKKRAKVALSLYAKSFPVDLGFEILEKIPRGGEGPA
ncbi:MAG: antiterminator LoaP [Spirochaetales bacterium]|jgi:transcriptional antiterminator NusG|nr:antiterminator LoaP [Spirochaetales bacterium]